MIEINFLPHELKTKGTKLASKEEYIRYFVLSGLALLVCLHCYLAVMQGFRYFRFRALDKKWKKLAPQKKRIDDFKQQHLLLSADAQAVGQLTSQRINVSQKLNILSLNLPSGVWFNNVAFTSEEFILNGSVVSMQKEELTLINKFIVNLKNDESFFSDFDNLELGTLQRRIIGGYTVIDFVLRGKLK